MLSARDIMTTNVVTVDPLLSAAEAAELLAKARISGAPVVGPRRVLLGVVSQTDLLRRRGRSRADVPAFYREGETGAHGTASEAVASLRVEDVMTPAVLSAVEETPVAELARFMRARRIHRVVITRDGVLRGIVTTMDMLRLVGSEDVDGNRRSYASSTAAGPFAGVRRSRRGREARGGRRQGAQRARRRR